ncbi:MAG: hypothetical protein ACK5A1_21835 [Planctomyces sp.]|jgi:hypothetical protein|nr:hypothetical protein [Planctomyces sp.]HAV32876.1 hypothetical protein [Planctomycetaceae bacterium]HBC63486.1 hypothetical protein [Planctomycetaceae bacterium]
MWKLTVTVNPHNQIEVCLGEESRLGECYYLGLSDAALIDPQVASADDVVPQAVENSVQSGLRQLLKGWLQLLQQLSDGGQVYLPFDFSDEYTRWVSVRREGVQVELVFGWAPVEGWAISVQDFSEVACGLTGFSPDEPFISQRVYLPRLICEVRRAMLG